jgi:hypothetical protein
MRQLEPGDKVYLMQGFNWGSPVLDTTVTRVTKARAYLAANDICVSKSPERINTYKVYGEARIHGLGRVYAAALPTTELDQMHQAFIAKQAEDYRLSKAKYELGTYIDLMQVGNCSKLSSDQIYAAAAALRTIFATPHRGQKND